jgi:hypothetical protein
MEEFMFKKITIFCILMFLIIIMSCLKENKETENQNNYNDIIVFLEENRDNICNVKDGKFIYITLYLEKDIVEEFYNNRLTYFINILKEDEENKKKYFEEHYKFISSNVFFDIKDNSSWVFDWSIGLFDYWLYDSIEKNFNNIKLPLKYIKALNWEYIRANIINEKK